MKLKPTEIQLLKEVIKTPRKKLLQEVKDHDLKEKQWLIETIEYYKKLYKFRKTPDKAVREIIQDFIKDLQEVNGRIIRLKEWINEG